MTQTLNRNEILYYDLLVSVAGEIHKLQTVMDTFLSPLQKDAACKSSDPNYNVRSERILCAYEGKPIPCPLHRRTTCTACTPQKMPTLQERQSALYAFWAMQSQHSSPPNS